MRDMIGFSNIVRRSRRVALAALLAMGVSACATHPPRQLEVAAPGTESLFPAGYEASRARFRRDCAVAAVKAGDVCGQWATPSATDPDLTVEYGIFSRGGDRLLVIQSGIHGTEAPAGAAVQARVMRDYLPKLLVSGIDVVFVHALNPWGFKYGRRNDEFNVNLNRNFSADGKTYEFPNPDYARLRGLFEPPGPVGSRFWGGAAVSAGFVGAFAANGFSDKALSNGLDNGQYQFPAGINYGGRGPQPQTAFLKQIVGPVLARPYRKTLYLDFHTGLGDSGVLAVILGKSPAPEPLRDLQAMLGSYRPRGIEITTPNDPGFFPTEGDVIDFLPSLSARPAAFLAVTMEYGTLGRGTKAQLESASRMILENQKYNHGCRRADTCETIERETREMFNPSDPVWRRAVIGEADLVFKTLLEKF